METVYQKVKAEELARMKLSGNENLDQVGNLAQQELNKLNNPKGNPSGAGGSTFMQ
jgi:hypothetical protein